MEVQEPKSSAETPSTTPTQAERDSTIEAVNHLIQGKRHLLVQDIPSAVTSLQEACRLLAESYGEVANECGDAYFYYGKALLEMAREDSSVLGNAIAGDDSDEDDEEETEIDKSEVENGEKKDQPVEKEAAEAKDTISTNDSQPGPSTSTDDGTKKEETEEEITNLQLAWEMLELSKLIFSRQSEGNKEKQLKLAEIHLYLGEVSLESENYGQAIEEFNQCLNIQMECLQPENRLLAETHYQLGLAHAFSDLFDEGVEHFKMAYQIIEEKIGALTIVAAGQEMEKEPDIMSAADPVKAAKEEIEELKALLPEIKDKIVDTEDMKKNAIDAVKNAAMNTATLFVDDLEKNITELNDIAMPSSSSESTSQKPVSNISHLIKRKRKNEVEGDEQEQKKIRCQVGSTSSQVSSTSEASTSSNSLQRCFSEAETTSSITSSEEAKVESRPQPDSNLAPVAGDDAECLVSSAGKSSERRKVSDSADHCDSVHNGEIQGSNVMKNSKNH
uniref:Tetratricopeptide SHNi-TPR domain-containing protein n=1 Tax=Strigamia maritima TaxID=126957 RepID=T1J7G1_STRMM